MDRANAKVDPPLPRNGVVRGYWITARQRRTFRRQTIQAGLPVNPRVGNRHNPDAGARAGAAAAFRRPHNLDEATAFYRQADENRHPGNPVRLSKE
jgi:hypothetical protein